MFRLGVRLILSVKLVIFREELVSAFNVLHQRIEFCLSHLIHVSVLMDSIKATECVSLALQDALHAQAPQYVPAAPHTPAPTTTEHAHAHPVITSKLPPSDIVIVATFIA